MIKKSLTALVVITLLVLASSVLRASEIHEAVMDGDIAKIKSMIGSNSSAVNARDQSGSTPLIIAARYGLKDVAALLLENGADINAQNNDGFTALHSAAAGNKLPVVKLLIVKYADTGARDKKGRTPIFYPADTNVAAAIINRGTDLKLRDNDGLSPLHFAITRGYTAVAELFIKTGADINARTNAGETPLKVAMKYNRADIVQMLQKAGALE
jgi:ankyrin repeat protein